MADQPDIHQRREIFFSGRVQGVGFRYTARQIASRFEVTGYVRNLHDGRVQLVVEGERGELDRYLMSLEAEMGRYIANRETDSSPVKNEFEDFQVRH